MSVTWFFWDPMPMFFIYLMSIGLYIVMQDPEARGELKVVPKSPYHFGLAFSFASFFVVGVYCLIVVAAYLLSVPLIDKWLLKRKKEQGNTHQRY